MSFSIAMSLLQEQRNAILMRLGQMVKLREEAVAAALLNFVPFEESEFDELIVRLDQVKDSLKFIAAQIEAAEDETE